MKTIIERRGENYEVGLGYGVTGLGDINGDGWPDVGVQTWNWLCQFRIYYGGPGILDNVPDLILPGGGNALMADMNGDGYKDLCLVIRRFTNHPGTDTLCVYLGRPGPGMRIDTVPAMRFAAPRTAYNFGLCMASGDLNGDGYADLALASDSYHDPGSPYVGKVFVFMGRAVIDSVPDFAVQDSTLHHWDYGTRCNIADLNGDGFDDLVVSGHYWDSDTTPVQDFGYLYVYLGKLGWTYNSHAPDQYLDPSSFGISKKLNVHMQYFDVLDVNNDAKADLLVGLDTAVLASVVNIYYGTTMGFSTTRDRFLRPSRNPFMTRGCRAIGDIDGDGYRDFVIPEAAIPMTVLYYYRGTASGMADEPFAYSYWDDQDGAYGNTPPPPRGQCG